MKRSGLAAGDIAPLAAFPVMATAATTAWPQHSRLHWPRGGKRTTAGPPALLCPVSPGVTLPRRRSPRGCSALPRHRITHKPATARDGCSREGDTEAPPPQHARRRGQSGVPRLLYAGFSTSSSVPPTPLKPASFSLLGRRALPEQILSNINPFTLEGEAW